MGKLFDIESPLMQGLNKLADLMWLNVLTLVCCIPIITAGASLTSAHYVALKLKRNEEGYITKEFFKAFKMNFKQSTLFWLVILLLSGIFALDFYIIKNGGIAFSSILQVVLMAFCCLFIFTVVWLFPVQAKFINSFTGTIRNAFALSIIQIPKTLLMIVMYILPYVLLWFTFRVFPIVLLFGISVPVYVSAMLYNKIFRNLEERITERMEKEGQTAKGDVPEDESVEKIFSDKPIIDKNEDV